MYKLENWSVVYDPNPFLAPECREPMLHGFSFGDPRREDGDEVTTSLIKGKRGDRVCTMNSEYELGEPDPNYFALYPNCRERLMGSLSEMP